MRRPFLTFVTIFALSAVVAFQLHLALAANAERGRLERQLALANEDNERLHTIVVAQQKAHTLEQTRAARTTIEADVEKLRGLKFLKPVDYNSVARADVRKVFSAALAEEMSDQEYADLGRAWTRLGLFPKPIQLREMLLDLLGEQVAAFYNHREHKLYMFEDASLEKTQDRVVLAHELVHALQDQHFNLLSLPIGLKTNDDKALAALSIIEGDATLIMTEYMAGNLSMQAVLESATSVFTTQMEQLKKAPRFLRDRLVFPYLRGRDFCASVMETGGLTAMNECYSRLPASTTQIMHPEKWSGTDPEIPIAVEWPDLHFHGEAPTVDNVAGEAGIRALFAEWLDDTVAKEASVGWRGDRYLSFAAEDALVWKSVWATATDAEKFFAAEKQVLAKRYELEWSAGDADAKDSLVSAKGSRVVRLKMNANHGVLVIDALTPTTADTLQAEFGEP